MLVRLIALRHCLQNIQEITDLLTRILRNTAANYVLKIVQMGLSLASVPILVSSVGPEGYGLLVLAGTVLGYFMFFDLGLSSAITKYVAEHHAQGDRNAVEEVVGTSLLLFSAIGVLVALFVFGLVESGFLNLFSIPSTLKESAENVFRVSAIMALLAWPQLVFEGTLRGLQDFVWLNIATGIGRILAVSLGIYCAWTGQPLEIVFLAVQCDILLSVLWLPMLVRRRLPGWQFRASQVRFATLSMMWVFSSWLMLGKIAVLLEYQLDTLLIGLVLPLAAITTYTVTVYPFRIIQQISGLAASAIMPAVSAEHSVGGDAAIGQFRRTGARIHNALVAVSALTMFFVIEPFLRLWMGNDYLEYLWLAKLACIFQLIWQSNALLAQVYVGTGQSKKLGVVAIITGVANFALSLLLVHVIGLSGVIIGTIGAGLIGVVIFVVWCLPDISISVPRYLYEIVARGQAPVWLAALVLLPFQSVFSQIDNWGALALATSMIAIFFCIVCYALVLTTAERRVLNTKFIKPFLRRSDIQPR